MTCIAALVKDGVVYMAGDRMTLSGQVARLTAHPKVYLKNNLLIGTCGGVRESNILEEELEVNESMEASLSSVMRDFVEPLRELYRKRGCLKVVEGVECMDSGAILLGFNGRLFCIWSDFQVDEYLEGYAAIGSGEEFALGSLFTTKNMVLYPQDRVMLAITAACEHCCSVAAPIDFLKV